MVVIRKIVASHQDEYVLRLRQVSFQVIRKVVSKWRSNFYSKVFSKLRSNFNSIKTVSCSRVK